MQSFLQYRKLKTEAQKNYHTPSVASATTVESVSSNKFDNNGKWVDEEKKAWSESSDSSLAAFQPMDNLRDNILVEFSRDDPQSPRNWSKSKKIWITCNIFINVLVLEWASACDSRLNTRISDYFGVSTLKETLDPAMYVYGIALGALVAGPISETLGRNPVYIYARIFNAAFILGAALAPNVQTQVVCRFFAGLGASQVLTIHGASLADIFDSNGRSIAWPCVAAGSFFGTVFAPVASGYISDNYSITWRWAEWITLILNCTSLLINILAMPETFAPILLKWKAENIRKITGNNKYKSQLELQDSVAKRLKTALERALHMTTREPIVLSLGMWLVVVYFVVFGFLQGFKYIFEYTYDFSEHLTGAAFAAIGVGLAISTVISVPIAVTHKKRARNWESQKSTAYPPEYRLWPSFPAAFLLPISMFWLGWTNYPSISPWSDLGAAAVFGYCWAAIYVAIYLYILDVYTIYAGSALATISFLRYIVAASIVVASTSMYEHLGVHYVMTMVGCIAAVLAVAPFIFFKFGPKIRSRSKFAGHHVSKSDPENIENPDVPRSRPEI